MKLRLTLVAVALIAFFSLACPAQDKGYWRSSSTNANNITGDIVIAERAVTIYFRNFPISRIRNLTPVETSALFDSDPGEAGTGLLYRIRVPAGSSLMRNNTLCGSNDADWMAAYISGRTLKVAFFSGGDMPVLTFEALQNSMDLCGHFTYAR